MAAWTGEEANMAQITVQDNSKVFQIQKFLGLNESPDGDTQLKLGEAAECCNWQITPSFHLKIRPGTKTLHQFNGPVRGLWSGWVNGEQVMLCAADGGDDAHGDCGGADQSQKPLGKGFHNG